MDQRLRRTSSAMLCLACLASLALLVCCLCYESPRTHALTHTHTLSLFAEKSSAALEPPARLNVPSGRGHGNSLSGLSRGGWNGGERAAEGVVEGDVGGGQGAGGSPLRGRGAGPPIVRGAFWSISCVSVHVASCAYASMGYFGCMLLERGQCLRVV